MAKQETFEWAEAFKIANEIRQKLEPHCQQIMIAGSLRRGCKTVHDIDIVMVPLPHEFDFRAMRLASLLGGDWRGMKHGPHITSGSYAGVPVDLYFATPDTWCTLVVIRTGSKEHNIKLCSRARTLGMKLHADGSGIETDPGEEYGGRYIPTSEQDLFRKLQLDYVEPKDRL